MFQRVRNLSSFGRINHLRYDNIPSRCGKEVCYCLIKLDLKDKQNKKIYKDCYDGWYKFYMRNKLELF